MEDAKMKRSLFSLLILLLGLLCTMTISHSKKPTTQKAKKEPLASYLAFAKKYFTNAKRNQKLIAISMKDAHYHTQGVRYSIPTTLTKNEWLFPNGLGLENKKFDQLYINKQKNTCEIFAFMCDCPNNPAKFRKIISAIWRYSFDLGYPVAVFKQNVACNALHFRLYDGRTFLDKKAGHHYDSRFHTFTPKSRKPILYTPQKKTDT